MLDHKDQKDLMVQEDLKENKDQKDHKDHKVNLVILDHKDLKDNKDKEDHKDLRVNKDHKDLRDLVDMLQLSTPKLYHQKENMLTAQWDIKLLEVVANAEKVTL